MSALDKPGAAWADFCDARLRLIHEWHAEGKSVEKITSDLNHHDAVQVRLLLMQEPEDLMPATTRMQLARVSAAFHLLGVAKRYAERDIGPAEMSAEVTDIVERMP